MSEPFRLRHSYIRALKRFSYYKGMDARKRLLYEDEIAYTKWAKTACLDFIESHPDVSVLDAILLFRHHMEELELKTKNIGHRFSIAYMVADAMYDEVSSCMFLYERRKENKNVN